MSYYGNTPSWVYHQKIRDLKDEAHYSETINEQKITNAVKKYLSVIDYSIICLWCDLNGYYFPIKRDFEKLEKIDNLEKQINEIGIKIERIKFEHGLSWNENSELNDIDAKINERESELKKCESENSENFKKANKLFKGIITRKKTLLEKKEKCDIKIAEESKILIEKQNDLKQQIDEIKKLE